jgi:hypothetical protein
MKTNKNVKRIIEKTSISKKNNKFKRFTGAKRRRMPIFRSRRKKMENSGRYKNKRVLKNIRSSRKGYNVFTGEKRERIQKFNSPLIKNEKRKIVYGGVIEDQLKAILIKYESFDQNEYDKLLMKKFPNYFQKATKHSENINPSSENTLSVIESKEDNTPDKIDYIKPSITEMLVYSEKDELNEKINQNKYNLFDEYINVNKLHFYKFHLNKYAEQINEYRLKNYKSYQTANPNYFYILVIGAIPILHSQNDFSKIKKPDGKDQKSYFYCDIMGSIPGENLDSIRDYYHKLYVDDENDFENYSLFSDIYKIIDKSLSKSECSVSFDLIVIDSGVNHFLNLNELNIKRYSSILKTNGKMIFNPVNKTYFYSVVLEKNEIIPEIMPGYCCYYRSVYVNDQTVLDFFKKITDTYSVEITDCVSDIIEDGFITSNYEKLYVKITKKNLDGSSLNMTTSESSSSRQSTDQSSISTKNSDIIVTIINRLIKIENPFTPGFLRLFVVSPRSLVQNYNGYPKLYYIIYVSKNLDRDCQYEYLSYLNSEEERTVERYVSDNIQRKFVKKEFSYKVYNFKNLYKRIRKGSKVTNWYNNIFNYMKILQDARTSGFPSQATGISYSTTLRSSEALNCIDTDISINEDDMITKNYDLTQIRNNNIDENAYISKAIILSNECLDNFMMNELSKCIALGKFPSQDTEIWSSHTLRSDEAFKIVNKGSFQSIVDKNLNKTFNGIFESCSNPQIKESKKI